jgi:hypothetical protein
VRADTSGHLSPSQDDAEVVAADERALIGGRGRYPRTPRRVIKFGLRNREGLGMAKNKVHGDDRRVGAVKGRSQVKNPVTGTWTKRDDKSGKFMDVKADTKPFKGVHKTKSGEVIERSSERFSDLMKRLAKR